MAETDERAHTILGRLAQAVRAQSWFAIGLELLIAAQRSVLVSLVAHS